MLFTIQLSSLTPTKSVSLNLIKKVSLAPANDTASTTLHGSGFFSRTFITKTDDFPLLTSPIDFRLSRNASLELKLSQNFNFTRLRCNPTRFDDQKATDRFVDFYDHFTVVLLIFLRRFSTAVLMLRVLARPLVFTLPLY